MEARRAILRTSVKSISLTFELFPSFVHFFAVRAWCLLGAVSPSCERRCRLPTNPCFASYPRPPPHLLPPSNVSRSCGNPTMQLCGVLCCPCLMGRDGWRGTRNRNVWRRIRGRAAIITCGVDMAFFVLSILLNRGFQVGRRLMKDDGCRPGRVIIAGFQTLIHGLCEMLYFIPLAHVWHVL